MDVDEVPAIGGSRPDRLPDVSGPQERVQRRTVQQIVLPIADSRRSCAADGGTGYRSVQDPLDLNHAPFL